MEVRELSRMALDILRNIFSPSQNRLVSPSPDRLSTTHRFSTIRDSSKLSSSHFQLKKDPLPLNMARTSSYNGFQDPIVDYKNAKVTQIEEVNSETNTPKQLKEPKQDVSSGKKK